MLQIWLTLRRTPLPHKEETRQPDVRFRLSARQPNRAKNIQSLLLNRRNENIRARSKPPVLVVLGAADPLVVLARYDLALDSILLPAQVHQLGGPQTMPEGQQDHGRIPTFGHHCMCKRASWIVWP